MSEPTDPTQVAHEAITTEPFAFCEHDDNEPMLTLEELVFQALGAASMCWSEAPSGTFESDLCATIAQALLDRIKQLEQPLLGLATTKQLLDEVFARLEDRDDPRINPLVWHVDNVRHHGAPEVLDYRTVDSA